jgi:hypothetical protein
VANEQGGDDRRRKLRIAALLWGLAAACALIAFVGDTIENGHVRWLRAIMAGMFILTAFVTFRRYRKT